jgi:NhaA family Na+:H+ antiporter
LYIPVSYLIIPLFILANAGVSLQGKSITAALSSGVSLGIVMGLLIGKQLGITLSSWVMIKLGWADLPDGVTWRHLYGVSWLGGIGFTMSLFIADLAFGSTQPATLDQAKVGILFALIVASTVGYIFLRFLTSTQKSQSPTAHNDC